MELASEGSFLPSPGRTRPPRFSQVIFELTSAIYLSPKERNKWKSSDVLIRVKFGPHDLTILKVSPIYQTVLLSYRRVCIIKICLYIFILFCFTHWQYSSMASKSDAIHRLILVKISLNQSKSVKINKKSACFTDIFFKLEI